MFKILKLNAIVDVVEELNFVRQNPRNKAIISCERESANGIVSSDGTVIWHLEGCEMFLTGDYESVSAVEILEEEFNNLKLNLSNEELIEETETIRVPLSTIEVMEKMEALQKRCEALEEELNALKVKNVTV